MPYKISNIAVDFTALSPNYTGSSTESYKAVSPSAKDPYGHTSGDHDGSTKAKAFIYNNFTPPGGLSIASVSTDKISCMESTYYISNKPILVPPQIYNKNIVGFLGVDIVASYGTAFLEVLYPHVYGSSVIQLDAGRDYFEFWIKRTLGDSVSYYDIDAETFTGNTKVINKVYFSSPYGWLCKFTPDDLYVYTICIRPTVNNQQGQSSTISFSLNYDSSMGQYFLLTQDINKPGYLRYYALPYDNSGMSDITQHCPLWSTPNL